MTSYAYRTCARCGTEKPRREKFFTVRVGRMSAICRECENLAARNRYQQTRENVLAQKRQWRAANRERARGYGRRAYEREKAKGAPSARIKRRAQSDPEFRLRITMRTRLLKALHADDGSKRGQRWSDIVGYSTTDLRAHLERQFEPWMSWANYGSLWHIDHIRPVAGFDLGKDETEIRACFALSNLRPLAAPKNRKKAAYREHLL